MKRDANNPKNSKDTSDTKMKKGEHRRLHYQSIALSLDMIELEKEIQRELYLRV